jgi:DNA polymerase III subunit beta
MKVIAQTTALQEALALAGSIIASRTPKPVLQCVKLSAADGVLTLLATDLEVGCRYQISAVQIEEEGEVLVPVDRFQGIVRESGSDSLTIESEKQAVVIRGAGSRFKVYGYDPGEYPQVAQFEEEGDFEISAVALSEMIGKTLFATAKAHSHYAISGVLWEATGKKLQLVATDGHRLAQAKGTLARAAAEDVTAIVPAKLMGMIQRVTTDGEAPLRVKLQENQVLVRTPQVVLVSSLVQGNFPKYTDVIPTDCTRKASIQTGEFEHRVRQAALLTNEESRGVKFSWAADQLTLSSRAPEAGEAEVSCPASLDGDPVDIAFNPQFLLDALKVIDVDEVSFEMTEASKPAVVKAGADFLYVLMPMEVN